MYTAVCATLPTPDNLARGIDEPKALEQVAAIVLQRRAVGTELFAELFFDLVGSEADALGGIGKPDDDGRLTDDSVLAVDQLGEFRKRLQAVAGARLSRWSYAARFSADFAAFLLPDCSIETAALLTARIRSCPDTRSYQISSVGIAANSIIAVRYAFTDACVAARASALR